MMLVPLPNGSNPARILNPRTQGMLSRMISTALTRTLLFLDQSNKSISKDMIFSNTATIVENAANVRNRKNKALHNCPPVIWANIFGIVINTRLGPDPGSIPKEKHAGMIMNPAISATNVSRAVMLTASPVRLLSLSM